MGNFSRIDFGRCTDKIVTTNTNELIIGGSGVDITIATPTPGLYIANNCTINATNSVYSNIICSAGTIGKGEGIKNFIGNIITGYHTSFGTGMLFNGNAIIGPHTTLENVTINGNVLFGQASKINRSTLGHSSVWGNALYPKSTTIGDNVSTSYYTAYQGLVSFGGGSTLNNGEYGGTTLLGNSSTINGGANHGNMLLGTGCTYNADKTSYGNLFGGNGIRIGDNVRSQDATWIIGRLSNGQDIDKLTYRYGLVLAGMAGGRPSYLIYYPKNSYAEANGNLRYGDNMSITDSDGVEIIKNGKLVLEYEVKQLKERIAQLESKLSQLGIE